jgi:chromatin segregation and condensation protein Rec8/ScpA/Scc1 (kleisin family)
MATLLKQLSVRRRALFQEIGGETPPVIVASFLAVLELARQNVVAVEQERPFAPIAVELCVGPLGK